MRLAILIPFLAVLLYTGDRALNSSSGAGDPDVDNAHVGSAGQNNAASLQTLGTNYFMSGDFKKATETLAKAADLEPDNAMIQTLLGRAWGRRAETSFALSAPGYATKARDAFQRALQLSPGNPEALDDLFNFYMAAPGLVGGGIEKAANLLPQFRKYDLAGFYLAQARLYQKKGQMAEAEASLRQAVQVAPQNIDPLLALAQFLSRQGRYAESEKVFQQAEALEPNSPKILFAEANADIEASRNVNQARNLLKQYLASNKLTPDDPPRSEAQSLLKKAQGS